MGDTGAGSANQDQAQAQMAAMMMHQQVPNFYEQFPGAGSNAVQKQDSSNNGLQNLVGASSYDNNSNQLINRFSPKVSLG